MAANVAVGVLQNILWSAFSIRTYQKLKKPWAAWPGLIVAWIVMAMSLELLDFPPWWGYIDAHSLWHLGTVVPTVWWYKWVINPLPPSSFFRADRSPQLPGEGRSAGYGGSKAEGVKDFTEGCIALEPFVMEKSDCLQGAFLLPRINVCSPNCR